MEIPGIHIETLLMPQCYSPRQIDRAFAIAAALNRGRLLLVEPPEPVPAPPRWPRPFKR